MPTQVNPAELVAETRSSRPGQRSLGRPAGRTQARTASLDQPGPALPGVAWRGTGAGAGAWKYLSPSHCSLRDQSLHADPGDLQAAGLPANADISLSGGLLSVDRSLLLDARGGNLQLQGSTLRAAGDGEGPGGTIALTGASLALRNSHLDASGVGGGGTVLVGAGGVGGRGDLIPARNTLVDAASTIRADATARGTGGSLVVWSEQSTSVTGTITARAGPSGGDGGIVETPGAPAAGREPGPTQTSVSMPMSSASPGR